MSLEEWAWQGNYTTEPIEGIKTAIGFLTEDSAKGVAAEARKAGITVEVIEREEHYYVIEKAKK